MSHRNPHFIDIADKCEQDLRTLLEIPEDFEVFLFQGGASLQFTSICFNLTKDNSEISSFIDTGIWSRSFYDEAKKYTDARKAAELIKTADNKFSLPPSSEWNIDPKTRFLHYCENETVQAMEFNEFPFEVVPEDCLLCCDMSSNFVSKKINWSRYACVFAGAQKNVGPSGCTFVVVRKDLIGHQRPDTPLMCDWSKFSKAQTKFHNTPACWPIYVAGLNLQHMIRNGGLDFYCKEAKAKTDLMYNYIDGSDSYYSNSVDPKYRSRMNVLFQIKMGDDLLEAKFQEEGKKIGLVDLKGHWTVVGLRASIYNAMPMEGVEKLVNFMKTFREENP